METLIKKTIENTIIYGLGSLVVISLSTLIYHLVVQGNYPTSFGIYG